MLFVRNPLRLLVVGLVRSMWAGWLDLFQPINEATGGIQKRDSVRKRRSSMTRNLKPAASSCSRLA